MFAQIKKFKKVSCEKNFSVNFFIHRKKSEILSQTFYPLYFLISHLLYYYSFIIIIIINVKSINCQEMILILSRMKKKLMAKGYHEVPRLMKQTKLHYTKKIPFSFLRGLTYFFCLISKIYN